MTTKSIRRSICFTGALFNTLQNYADTYFQGNISSCVGFIVSKFFAEDKTKTDNSVSAKKIDLHFLDD